jgi:undecaprenyl-diphosphatase
MRFILFFAFALLPVTLGDAVADTVAPVVANPAAKSASTTPSKEVTPTHAIPAPAATPPPAPASADDPVLRRPISASRFLGCEAAVALGVTEGLTEYLPVSSTGHLILVNELLGLNRETPVSGHRGEPLFAKEKAPLPTRLLQKFRGEKTAEPKQVPFTLKNAADAYVIVIQFGAILAVLFVYWGRVSRVLLGLVRLDGDSFRLTLNLAVAFFPAAVLGLLFNKNIEAILFGVLPVVVALFAGAFVMLGVEYWYRRKRRLLREDGATGDELRGPDLHEMGAFRAFGIGVAQCAALCPGTSRSMATICGGYLAGLSPARATEFSFLLGLVTLTCASVYKTISSGKNMLAAFDIGPLALGLVVAAVTSFFAVKWMVAWISTRGLALFAWYRIALSALLYWFFFIYSA